MRVIETEDGQPIFSWCQNPEPNAIIQMIDIAKLPYVEHCALMPDTHVGMNMPIGGVVACDNVVVPDFVGSDAGCGIVVQKTSLKRSDLIDRELRKRILNSIKRGLPMGFNHNSDSRQKELLSNYGGRIEKLLNDNDCYFDFLEGKGLYDVTLEQIGTLGGGNHYLSLDYDQNDYVWIMVHSGSRNIGYKLNDYYNKKALELNSKWHSNSFVGFLPVDTEYGKRYLDNLKFALEFAHLNRQIMVDDVKHDLSHFFSNIEFFEQINIHHNYASLENFNNKNVWVHRKGAVNASKDVNGIIPGSMGTASYIVKGIGNPKSLNSSSHGAGRKMGRKEFNRINNTPEMLAEISKSMEDVVYIDFSKEVLKGRKQTGLIDVSESPLAYKDIEVVMAEQTDLVQPINKLMPMINLKG